MNRIRRVVFDTSTLVSAALRTGSVPHQALVSTLGACDLCASEETLAELARVLGCRKFDRYLDAGSRRAFVALIGRHVHRFAVQETDKTLNVACRDPEDNKFLAVALAAEVDAVVSSDEDLLVLHPWCGIPILSPADFLSRPNVDPAVKEGA